MGNIPPTTRGRKNLKATCAGTLTRAVGTRTKTQENKTHQKETAETTRNTTKTKHNQNQTKQKLNTTHKTNQNKTNMSAYVDHACNAATRFWALHCYKFTNPDLIIGPLLIVNVRAFHMDHHLQPSFGAPQRQTMRAARRADFCACIVIVYLADEDRGSGHYLPVARGSGLTGSSGRCGDRRGSVVGDVRRGPLLALSYRMDASMIPSISNDSIPMTIPFISIFSIGTMIPSVA